MSFYENCSVEIKSRFTKAKLKEIDSIKAFESTDLANGGSNDTEGYQVFTPQFIVHDMCEVIGPGEACTHSYFVVGSFKEKIFASSFFNWRLKN